MTNSRPTGRRGTSGPYFPRPRPLVVPVRGSHAHRTAKVRQSVEYGWVHSMGEIVSAVAGAGLRIEFLHDFPLVEWPVPFLVRHDDGIWRLPADAGGAAAVLLAACDQVVTCGRLASPFIWLAPASSGRATSFSPADHPDLKDGHGRGHRTTCGW